MSQAANEYRQTIGKCLRPPQLCLLVAVADAAYELLCLDPDGKRHGLYALLFLLLQARASLIHGQVLEVKLTATQGEGAVKCPYVRLLDACAISADLLEVQACLLMPHTARV